MNKFRIIKSLLDDDIEICKHTTNTNDLRKIIARLKSDYNYKINRFECDCNLHDRKHYSYEKDWAYS